MPPAVAEIDVVVSPVLQWYVPPPPAVNVTLVVAQVNVVTVDGVMTAEGILVF